MKDPRWLNWWIFLEYPRFIPLPIEPQNPVGESSFNDRIKILLEYKIAPKLTEGETITLLQGTLLWIFPP
jgi:hypothetical protein